MIYGMWGLFVFAPVFADYIQPFFIKYFGDLPLIGMLFQGAPMGIGMFAARPDSGDYDYSVYRLGDARCV